MISLLWLKATMVSRPSSVSARRLLLLLLTMTLAWRCPTLAQVPCPSRCRSCDNQVAECSGRSLNAPPRTYPPGTRTINLEGNHIRVVAERTFARLDSVEVLKIANNKIMALRNDAFSPFPSLMHLDLTENRISRIGRRSFHGLDNLRTLSLNRNKIESIEGIFQHTPRLYQLNAAHNTITAIGQNDLSSLTEVNYLYFQDNLISEIHREAFKNTSNLRFLFLNNNPRLVSLPQLEFSSPMLQLVDLSSCQLTSVPGNFPSSLSDLRLSNNRIMQVGATDLANLTNLQLLALNDNELHYIADGTLAHLTHLQEIWLRQNQLVYIPRGIPNNVRKVHMDSNNIQQIEQGIFSNMSHLIYLTVATNQIHRIQPHTFRGLRFLDSLNFQGNLIHTLETDTFVDLDSLSSLLLSNNPLSTVKPGAFKNLGNLTQLLLNYIPEENFQLEYNFLPEMLRLKKLQLINSPGLASALMNFINDPDVLPIPLARLQELDLSYNTLQWISPRIQQFFPNLQSLQLDGNPFHCSQRLKWLHDWMISNPDMSFHNYEEIVCDSPASLKDRTILSLQDHEWKEDTHQNTVTPGVDALGDQAFMASDTDMEQQAQVVAAWQPYPKQSEMPTAGQSLGVGKESKENNDKHEGKKKSRDGQTMIGNRKTQKNDKKQSEQAQKEPNENTEKTVEKIKNNSNQNKGKKNEQKNIKEIVDNKKQNSNKNDKNKMEKRANKMIGDKEKGNSKETSKKKKEKKSNKGKGEMSGINKTQTKEIDQDHKGKKKNSKTKKNMGKNKEVSKKA